MFVQLLNQNATNIPEKKNKAIYGFSSFSYTLVFINSFLSSGSSGVTRKKGGQLERKGLELASGVEGERKTMGGWEEELGEEER